MSNQALEEGLLVLQKEIDRLTKMAEMIKENLEYADGQAYYDERDRMNKALREAYVLGRVREVVRESMNAKTSK